jgi:hypothetical protein
MIPGAGPGLRQTGRSAGITLQGEAASLPSKELGDARGLVRGGKLLKYATDERCNYLGGVVRPAEIEHLDDDDACLLVRQGT